MKTVIGPGTRITGPLCGTDDLEVYGVVDGEVRGEAAVLVAAGARVHGAVRGRDVTIGGELGHPVYASGLLRLLSTARVSADVEVARIAIDEGAELDGQIKMRKKAAPAEPPPLAVAAQPDLKPEPERRIPELASPGRRAIARKSS